MTEAFYFLLGSLCGAALAVAAFAALCVACYRWTQRANQAPDPAADTRLLPKGGSSTASAPPKCDAVTMPWSADDGGANR